MQRLGVSRKKLKNLYNIELQEESLEFNVAV